MSELQDLIKQLHERRTILAIEQKNEKELLAKLKEVATFQQYEAVKRQRLLESKEVRAYEDELRDALIADLIDGGAINLDNRHPAVHSITCKTLYDYDTKAAVQYAMENGLVHCLTIDKSKFDSYLSHLAESNAPLPEFVEAVETVSVSLKSDLSDILGGDA